MFKPNESKDGKIITFYSYKGGTGRTMSLSNIACLIGMIEPDKKVLVMDWDLEAPGLHRYFAPYDPDLEEKVFDKQQGILELFEIYQKAIKATKQTILADCEEVLEKVDLNQFIVELSIQSNLKRKKEDNFSVFFLKAGEYNNTYTKRLSHFDWNAFFYSAPTFFQEFAEYLCQSYDYILVDSRTGNTDIGGICTHLLPEKLVTVFTPNKQSLTGILDLAKKATSYRVESSDFRPLEIIPLPSRIDLENSIQRVNWKNGNEAEGIIGYQTQFEQLLKEIYNLETSKISLEKYFNGVQIRHDSTYAYGEKIAVLEENWEDTSSFANNYWQFYQELFKEDNIYELPNLKNVLIYYKKGLGKITSALVDELYNIENEEVVIFYAHNQTEELELGKLAEQADLIITIAADEFIQNKNTIKENNSSYSSRNDLIIERFLETKKSFRIPVSMSQDKLVDFRIEGESEEFTHYRNVIEEKLVSLRTNEIRTNQILVLDKIAKLSKNEHEAIKNYMIELRGANSKQLYPNPLEYEDSELYNSLSEKGKTKVNEGRNLILNYNDFFLSSSEENAFLLNKEFSALIGFFFDNVSDIKPVRNNLLALLIFNFLRDEGLVGNSDFENYLEKERINPSISFVQLIDNQTFNSKLTQSDYSTYVEKAKENNIEILFFPILTEHFTDLMPTRSLSNKNDWINEVKNTQHLDLSTFSNAAIFNSKNKDLAISNAAKIFKREIKSIAQKIVQHRENMIDKYIEKLT